MGSPWVVDGGNGSQIQVVTVSILKKHLQTADKERYYSMGIGANN
jgi:hypothetical protein